MFESSYIYCKVSFESGEEYYYRTDQRNIKVGDRVIVPVSNNGKWEIGMVVTVEKYSLQTVPYPLDQTKGTISKASPWSESKVKRHNEKLVNSKYPPIDISKKYLRTENGYVLVITTSAERERLRDKDRPKGQPLIENYPPATREEVRLRPRELEKP